MSRTGRLSRFFGDADHEFRIGIGEAEEIDEKHGCGLLEALERCSMLHVGVIATVLRVGLVGAGMKRQVAAQLVSRHLVDGYFLECSTLAAAVLDAAVRGVADDPPGEPAGETLTPAPSPMAA